MNIAVRKTELLNYVKTLCRIYYDRNGHFHKDPGIRTLINKAKEEMRILNRNKREVNERAN